MVTKVDGLKEGMNDLSVKCGLNIANIDVITIVFVPEDANSRDYQT
jgi:hypothetical protein